jgi:hypothetical protein
MNFDKILILRIYRNSLIPIPILNNSHLKMDNKFLRVENGINFNEL